MNPTREPRAVVLVGGRGAGKTTVGRLLAERVNLPFWDADCEIEAQTGRTIAEIFAESGEPGFRDVEEQVLETLCREHPRSVLATGGGAVLRSSSRRRIRDHGLVVWLRARPEELARRIAHDDATAHARPPLTQAGVIDEIEHVLAERAALYAEVANFAVDATDAAPEDVANAIVAHWFSLTETRLV